MSYISLQLFSIVILRFSNGENKTSEINNYGCTTKLRFCYARLILHFTNLSRVSINLFQVKACLCDVPTNQNQARGYLVPITLKLTNEAPVDPWREPSIARLERVRGGASEFGGLLSLRNKARPEFRCSPGVQNTIRISNPIFLKLSKRGPFSLSPFINLNSIRVSSKTSFFHSL